jgi:quinoprotein glucose dehydrogenase
LIFIGGSNDERFRAFDRDSGEQLWETRLDASGHANPMTYTGPESGKQFVVIAAGGGNKLSFKFSDALEAYCLE